LQIGLPNRWRKRQQANFQSVRFRNAGILACVGFDFFKASRARLAGETSPESEEEILEFCSFRSSKANYVLALSPTLPTRPPSKQYPGSNSQ
jgi:hypothetical protein